MRNTSPRVRMMALFALRAVTLVALLYIVLQNWNQLALDPQKYNFGLIVLSGLLYPISFYLILFVWFRIVEIQFGSSDWRRDSAIYCYSNLVRSLPFGLFWRIGGRVAFYSEENISRSATILASLWEIVLHIASAILLLIAANLIRPISIGGWFWALVLAIATIALFAVARRISCELSSGVRFNAHGMGQRLLGVLSRRGKDLALILFLNAVTWLNAGAMLQLLVQAISPGIPADYLDMLEIWLISALIGYIVLFLPFLDVGIKEGTMALFLSAHMPLALGVVIAILFRLIFIVSDVLWSLFVLVVVRLQSAGRSYV